MSKVTGATLEFWYGGVEYPVESVSFDAAGDEIETTDSATPTPSTDFIMNRFKRTSKVDMQLAAADGTTLTGNNLVAGTRYKVKLGNLTESTVAHTYPVGKCFTSDGTGVASASNQVAALGAKLPGKNMVANIASANVGVTSIKHNEAYGEFDSTDSDTTGDGTEWVTGRVKRTATVEMIMKDTVADYLTSNPVAQAVVFTLGAGLTLTGSAIFSKKSINSLAKGDMVKVTYDLLWVGAVASTLANELTMGVSTATKAIWKGWGASTQKGVTGNTIVMSKSVEIDTNGIAKVSYSLGWVGTPTEVVLS